MDADTDDSAMFSTDIRTAKTVAFVIFSTDSPVLETRDSGVVLDDLKGIDTDSFWGVNVCHFDELVELVCIKVVGLPISTIGMT
jgi:hypothetical protein